MQTVAKPDGHVDKTSPRFGLAPQVGLAVGAVALLVLILTLSPTVNFTDSGELTAVAWVLGIPHPSGYPLYTLLTSAWIHLPFGNPAWRMNLLSALFGALTVVLVYGWTIYSLNGLPVLRRDAAKNGGGTRQKQTRPVAAPPNRRGTSSARSVPQVAREAGSDSSSQVAIANNSAPRTGIAIAGGLTAAGLLAFSLAFWDWATQTKMYTLHYGFMAALLWLALWTRRALLAENTTPGTHPASWNVRSWSAGVRGLHALALLTGLSLTNHFMTFLLLPGIAVLLLAPAANNGSPARSLLRYAPTLIPTLLAPLLLYLYLPLRAAASPLLNWGDPATWDSFWRHVTGWQYQGAFSLANMGAGIADGLVYAANQFGIWYGLIILALTVFGLSYLWRTDKVLLLASATVLLVSLIYCFGYNIREISAYYVQVYIIAIWWAGLGLAWAVSLALTSRPALAPTFGRAAIILAGVVAPIMALLINWGSAGHRDDYTGELYLRNTYKNLQTNALVLTNLPDLTSGSYYLRDVLGERQDVLLVNKDLLFYPYYLDELKRLHPDLPTTVISALNAYEALLKQWITTGFAPGQLDQAYLDLLYSFIDTGLGQRPVYLLTRVSNSDQQGTREIQALLDRYKGHFVPDGLGYRIVSSAGELTTQDPQWNLRGILTDKVPLDEIAAEATSLYPEMMGLIGNYLNTYGATDQQKQAGAQLLNTAQQLQPLAARSNERPILR